MHPVGFEPTHLSIAELKSAPLDHSGTNAICFFYFFFIPFSFLKKLYGDEGYRSPCPSHAKRMLYHMSYIPLFFFIILLY